jgi:glycine/D-amino acid oxidase-like deaminating enzyme
LYRRHPGGILAAIYIPRAGTHPDWRRAADRRRSIAARENVHTLAMQQPSHLWGDSPWTIDFHPAHHSIPADLPAQVDVAIVGGGFTGLAAAAWLRRIAPDRSVALLEAESIGAGASGRTGGMALSEAAAGDLPGLGDVLAGFAEILRALGIDCDLDLGGALEIGRSGGPANSPIAWPDSGKLRIVGEVPGGTIDPGKLVGGMAHAAENRGALILESARVEEIAFENPLRLAVAGREIRADRVLIATNAMSLELGALAARTTPKLTLALATEPLSAQQIEAIGLGARKPFYTVDFPYLWGRMLPSNAAIFGCGLVEVADWQGLYRLSVNEGKTKTLLDRLETRVRNLHPALGDVAIAHRWGGPILLTENWEPIFERHPRSERAIVLGGYCGHGVALSTYLAAWAAEALLGRRELPRWNSGELDQ